MKPQDEPSQQLPPNAPRFLTVCEGGNCRSVSLAMMLKATKKYDAIACSWKDISETTFDMLAAWAHRIIVMEGYMLDKIPERHRDKVMVLDVGEDRWCNPFHPELTTKIAFLMNEQNKRVA